MSDPGDLLARFRAVRACSEALCEPLAIEDHVVQTMADVSPPKWHLAHTTWFFEAMVLERFVPGYVVVDRAYGFLFNSYYEAVGPRWTRAERGALSRPTVAEVRDYRRAVDERVARFLLEGPAQALAEAAPILEIGLHHEQQHQELLATDIKYILASSPFLPAYQNAAPSASQERPAGFAEFD
ncbi:MAG: DinB family protein, partial [Myxococcales bacterium]|nr:DinB family protein [Myxococcales bacterium]